jgi:hypothetical protein
MEGSLYARPASRYTPNNVDFNKFEHAIEDSSNRVASLVAALAVALYRSDMGGVD